jgi:exonuclease 1
MLQRYKVNPILVFDGGPLPMKAYREEQRAQRRTESKKKADEFMKVNARSAHLSTSALSHMSKSADVTPEMAFMLIEALKKEKIEFIVAPYVADAQLAYLDRIGRVAAVISEDSDLLLFGIKRVLFKMDKFGSAEEVCLDRLGSCSEIDLREFTLQKVSLFCVYKRSVNNVLICSLDRCVYYQDAII